MTTNEDTIYSRKQNKLHNTTVYLQSHDLNIYDVQCSELQYSTSQYIIFSVDTHCNFSSRSVAMKWLCPSWIDYFWQPS